MKKAAPAQGKAAKSKSKPLRLSEALRIIVRSTDLRELRRKCPNFHRAHPLWAPTENLARGVRLASA